MKKYLVAILCCLFFTPALAQKTLTLDQAIQIALQGNSNLIKSINSLESAKKNVKSAYGDLLPSLSAGADWSWRRDEVKTSRVNFFGQSVETGGNSESRSWSADVGGGITLFNGLANYANISGAENDLESAQLSLSKLKQDIVQVTAELYYSVLNADALVKVREDNVAYNEKLFETIEERNRLGSVPVADVYAQQVQLGNSQLQLIEAQNNLDVAKNSLLTYLALDVLEDYEFIDPFEGIESVETESYMKEFGEMSSMVAEALNMRLDYQSKKFDVESADDGVTAAMGGYFPRLTGSFGFSSGAIAPGDLFENKTYSAGLSLNIPIFSNWNTENAVQFAEVQYKNAQEDLMVLERTIKIEVKQGYLSLQAGKKSLEVARENVKAAEENRRINNERYSLGSGTILDVLQSDRDYTQALNDRINAKFEFYKLRDALLNALGKLDFQKYE